MKALEIISQSWPFAIMFIGACFLLFGLRLVRWFKQADEAQREYRISQARDVTRRTDY